MTVRDLPIERKRSLCVVSCWLLVADCTRMVIFSPVLTISRNQIWVQDSMFTDT